MFYLALISEQDKKVIGEMFQGMTTKVSLSFFTDKNSRFSKDAEEILTELTSISDKIELKVHDFEQEKAKAQSIGIDKTPAVSVQSADGTDYGIKFYGVPSGYEFGTLIEDIVMIGKQATELSSATKEKLATVTKDTHIQVFVTPT